jgi:hypothetical protein
MIPLKRQMTRTSRGFARMGMLLLLKTPLKMIWRVGLPSSKLHGVIFTRLQAPNK